MGGAARRAARAGEVRDLGRARAGARGDGDRGRDPARRSGRRRARSASSPATAWAQRHARGRQGQGDHAPRAARYFQDITVAHLDHMLLSTIPMEANLYRAVRAMVPSVKAVRVPAPFTCYVSIEQRIAGPGQERDPRGARRRPLHEARGGRRPRRGRLRRSADELGHRHALPARPRHHDRQPTRAAPTSTRRPARTATRRKWGVDATAKPSLAALHAAPPRAARRHGAPGSRRRSSDCAVALNFARLLDARRPRAPRPPALVVGRDGALTYAELQRRAGGLRALARRSRRARRRSRRALAPERLGVRRGAARRAASSARSSPRSIPGSPPTSARAILDDLRPRLVARRGRGRRGRTGRRSRRPTRPALVLYTSGSTGRPKGAVLSHAALSFAVNGRGPGPVMALTPTTSCSAVLPFSHSYGIERRAAGAAARRRRASYSSSASRPDDVLAASAAHARHRASRGRHDVSPPPRRAGGRPRDVSAACAWRSRAPRRARGRSREEWRERTGVRILRGYGMTELFRPLSYLARTTTRSRRRDRPPGARRGDPRDRRRRAPAAGRRARRAADPDAGRDGRLSRRSPTRRARCSSTAGSGPATSRASRPRASSRIAGRKRELILRGGYSVFPPEVEAVLARASGRRRGRGRRHPPPRARRGGRRLRGAARGRARRSPTNIAPGARSESPASSAPASSTSSPRCPRARPARSSSPSSPPLSARRSSDRTSAERRGPGSPSSEKPETRDGFQAAVERDCVRGAGGSVPAPDQTIREVRG